MAISLPYDYLMSLVAPQALPTPVAPAVVPAPVATPPIAPVAPPIMPIPVPVLPNTEPDEQTKQRNSLRSQAESAFGSDYGRRNIASTLLDDTINTILSEQQNDARTYLDRGRARGIYNDVGYGAGVSRIGTAAEAGRSKLFDLGRGVIDKYRADADAVRDRAYSAISGYQPGNNFSLDPYINEGREVIDRARTLGGGDLRSAFGGTKLFDFGELNNRAGQAQGAIGNRDADVLSAVNARRRANRFGRGLGSVGAF